jgi:hypothetical protein
MDLIHVNIFTMASSEGHNFGITDGRCGVESLRSVVFELVNVWLVPVALVEIECPEVP